MHTILRVAIVNITIAKRSPGTQIPTNPNRNHLADLIKHVVKLRISHVEVKITNIKRSRHKLDRSRSRRHSVGSRYRSPRLMQLNLRHLKSKQTGLLDPSKKNYFFFFCDFFVSLSSCYN